MLERRIEEEAAMYKGSVVVPARSNDDEAAMYKGSPLNIPSEEVATEVHIEPLPSKTFPFVGVPFGIVDEPTI